MNFIWVILTFGIVLVFLFWIYIISKNKLQLNKLRRKYVKEEDLSRKPEFQGRFQRGAGESENTELLPLGDGKPIKRELLPNKNFGSSGQDKPEHSRIGSRRRRGRRRRFRRRK